MEMEVVVVDDEREKSREGMKKHGERKQPRLVRW